MCKKLVSVTKESCLSFQPFQRFVEIGRVAVIQDGDAAGKIAAIVDVIDQNRVSYISQTSFISTVKEIIFAKNCTWYWKTYLDDLRVTGFG